MRETRPESVEFVDRAPRQVVVERTIAAAPERVFDALADAPGWTEWFAGVKTCEWTSAEHGGVGSTRRIDVNGLRVEEEFVAWDRPRRWAFTFIAVNRPLATAGVELAELEPAGDGGTRLRYTMALEPTRAVNVAWPLLARQVRRGLARGLAGLDAHLATD